MPEDQVRRGADPSAPLPSTAGPPRRRVAVACSGGRDSAALLHATAHAATALGLGVAALHVHHGLHPDADAWLMQVGAACAALAQQGHELAFLHHRLEDRPPRGASVEAWARRARYAALARLAHEAGSDLVLLAHHRRDQAETFLLQALRGGGARGLAAMPARIERDGIVWARPWLDHPREAIEAYVQQHGLAHADDPSNADPRFARNRLRLQVWPAWREAFPGAEERLAAAAARAAREAECLRGLARDDLQGLVEGEGALRLAAWQALGLARRDNALREWLRERTGRGPDDALVERLLVELPGGAGPARWPVAGGAGELRRYRGLLRWHLPTAATSHDATPARGVQAPIEAPLPLHLDKPGDHALPAWGGVLRVEAVESGGIARARLATATLHARTGGEQFQRTAAGLPRALKKQFQSAGVPPWNREGPLVRCGGLLAWVPGLGVDARAQAAPGEPQCALRWLSCPSPKPRPLGESP